LIEEETQKALQEYSAADNVGKFVSHPDVKVRLDPNRLLLKRFGGSASQRATSANSSTALVSRWGWFFKTIKCFIGT